ncbi:MAG: DUF3341 domain-containing protein [Acidobacteriota bacterium]
MEKETGSQLYGVMAEFETPDDLLIAARRAYDQGYRKMDAYTPHPIHGLAEALGSRTTRVPLIVLLGGIAGGTAGYLLQYWVNMIATPYNVAGRPLHSWPAFIVPTFEMTILFAALSAVIGMLLLNGLPRPYHPVFNVPNFTLASRDRFFLCIEAADEQFDEDETMNFLSRLGPLTVSRVAE